jgi:hypothetical protein
METGTFLIDGNGGVFDDEGLHFNHCPSPICLLSCCVGSLEDIDAFPGRFAMRSVLVSSSAVQLKCEEKDGIRYNGMDLGTLLGHCSE